MTDRQTDEDSGHDRQIQKDKDSYHERESDRQTWTTFITNTDRKIESFHNRQTEKPTDRKIDRATDRLTERPRDSQPDEDSFHDRRSMKIMIFNGRILGFRKRLRAKDCSSAEWKRLLMT